MHVPRARIEYRPTEEVGCGEDEVRGRRVTGIDDRVTSGTARVKHAEARLAAEPALQAGHREVLALEQHRVACARELFFARAHLEEPDIVQAGLSNELAAVGDRLRLSGIEADSPAEERVLVAAGKLEV